MLGAIPSAPPPGLFSPQEVECDVATHIYGQNRIPSKDLGGRYFVAEEAAMDWGGGRGRDKNSRKRST